MGTIRSDHGRGSSRKKAASVILTIFFIMRYILKINYGSSLENIIRRLDNHIQNFFLSSIRR